VTTHFVYLKTSVYAGDLQTNFTIPSQLHLQTLP